MGIRVRYDQLCEVEIMVVRGTVEAVTVFRFPLRSNCVTAHRLSPLAVSCSICRLTFNRHKCTVNLIETVTESSKVEISAVPISKKVYIHDPALPRSTQTDTKSVIVVTNRKHVRFEKLQADNQHDYKMLIDAVEMLPSTWQHVGLPPDGTLAPKHMHDASVSFLPPTDYEGFTILVTAACNLVMRQAALSYHDRKKRKEDDVKVEMMPAKRLPSYRALPGSISLTSTMNLRDELDEERMVYVLGMLVRLFYRGDDETGQRRLEEQELRKAVILYMSGTGGASQFTNFTSLFMSLELAVGFAESEGITSNDTHHKVVALLIDAIRWSGIDPIKSGSTLVKSCRAILGDVMAGRVYKYTKLNNRLKHHWRNTEDAKYFDNNIDKISEIMHGLRVDAAYVILLGLIKLYGTGSPPAPVSKTHRTSQLILCMIKDCVNRHGAESVDGDVEQKIRYLVEFIENDGIKSNEAVYDSTSLVLRELIMLVKAARMLDAPDGLKGVRALVRKHEDIVPDRLKPTKLGFDIDHDEDELHNWLVFIVHSVVMWMDSQFHHTYVIQHVAQFGKESWIKCDAAPFG